MSMIVNPYVFVTGGDYSYNATPAAAGLTTTQASSVWGSEFVADESGMSGSFVDDDLSSRINSEQTDEDDYDVFFYIPNPPRPTKKVYLTCSVNTLIGINISGSPDVAGVDEGQTIETVSGTEHVYSFDMSGGGDISSIIFYKSGGNFYVRFWDGNPA